MFQLVRGLPTLGERFESIEELVAVTYIALLRVYGSGTRYNSPTSLHIECARAHSSYRKTSEGTCRWRLAFEKDQSTREVIVCRDRSHLYHNHGANPKLVKDPNWKPTIQNKLVRKRLGMDELGSGRQVRFLSCASFSFNENSHYVEMFRLNVHLLRALTLNLS